MRKLIFEYPSEPKCISYGPLLFSHSLYRYYFDGQGKAIRPVIALTVGHAFNHHFATLDDINTNSREFSNLQRKQRQVSIISEMIHTASLVHDDILDKADTRRGKKAVNQK